MTKQDIVREVSQRLGIENGVTKIIVNEIIDIIASNLRSGKTIHLRGLFTLSPIVRKEKVAQDIRKKQLIRVPAHITPFAKFSKEIRDDMKKLPVK